MIMVGLSMIFLRIYHYRLPLTVAMIMYMSRNMHTVYPVVLLWFTKGQFYLRPVGSLHWHRVNFTIARVPVRRPRIIWMNTQHLSIVIDVTQKSHEKISGHNWAHTHVEYRYNAVQYSKLLHKYIAGTQAEYESNAGSTKHPPDLATTAPHYVVLYQSPMLYHLQRGLNFNFSKI